MTTVDSQVCRITVIGPNRKVDLAVPIRMPIAQLLPALLRQTTGDGRDTAVPEGSWVLQRLGHAPFDLSGTPEGLDWLEGEQLYLRPAENPLPDLDFDDIADGVATMVNRRADRWKPEYRRGLFMVLAALAMVASAGALLSRGPVVPQVAGSAVLAVALLSGALVVVRQQSDPSFGLLLGGGAALFAAAAGASAADGKPDGIGWTSQAVLAGAAGVLVVAGILLLAQRTLIPALPLRPILVSGVTALFVVAMTIIWPVSGMSPQGLAATFAALLFGLVLLGPRIAVKLSRLRGPQLPKTGADMTYDIEPQAAATVNGRTDDADAYLTVTAVAAALIMPVLFRLILGASGWSGRLLVLVMAAALLLRARAYFGLWQRLAMVFAGVAGLVLTCVSMTGVRSAAAHYVLVIVLAVLAVPLLMAARRPWPQRMLPFWEYTATFLDVTTAIVVLPLLGEVLGAYAWARGLFG